ncbi:tetraspanin family protein [Paenibacillus endoradicis]|uniref:tetraspanin family protein n=1 Tax=Paenibacillus endoradicis TaxID=2972487 RepID=UPI002159A276|nr:tetraspanin family protein [Paenibacillus endoradicis]MCR8658934.1 tetraspanin family protein [Paenibacillus endoradicis]
MEDNNQSKSSPSPSNDNQATPSTESSSEQLAPSQPKSFKAFGTYNPNLAQEVQHAGVQNIAPTAYATGDQTQYTQTYGSSNSNPQQHHNYPPPPGPVQPLKHSGLGITSFIFSLVSILTIIIGLVVMFSSMTSLSLSELELMQDPTYIEDVILNSDSGIPSGLVGIIVGVVLMFSSGFFGFIGLIFGIISVCLKNRRKIFGILGTIFNSLILVGGFIFFVFSLIASGL